MLIWTCKSSVLRDLFRTRERGLREGLVLEETVEHVERGLGLIHGRHVSSIVDLEPSESLEVLDTSSDVATDLPGLEGGSVETALSSPLHVLGPVVASVVVANEVLYSRVDEDAHSSLENDGQVLGKGRDPVSGQHAVHSIVARLPVARWVDSEGSLNVRLVQESDDGGHIVAQGLDLCRNKAKKIFSQSKSSLLAIFWAPKSVF